MCLHHVTQHLAHIPSFGRQSLANSQVKKYLWRDGVQTRRDGVQTRHDEDVMASLLEEDGACSILMLATLKQDRYWRHHVYFTDISMIPLSSHVTLGVDLITLLGQRKFYQASITLRQTPALISTSQAGVAWSCYSTNWYIVYCMQDVHNCIAIQMWLLLNQQQEEQVYGQQVLTLQGG